MKLIIMSLLFITISCGQNPLTAKRTAQNASATSTEEEISCSCTYVYKPVCGNGKTFDNSCIADCYGVSQYTNGTCTDSCDSTRAVCGQPPMIECPAGMFCTQAMPTPVLYTSECEMLRANATFISFDSCSN